jgi:hypothetical protein
VLISITEECCLIIREIADVAGISRDSANTILTEDLGKRRVAAKFVPKLLSPKQQQLRFEVAQDSKLHGIIINNLAKVVTLVTCIQEVSSLNLRWETIQKFTIIFFTLQQKA